MTVGIVGTGLIGGSLALALRNVGHEVIGYDSDEEHSRVALERQLISEVVDLRELARRSTVIAVCVPADHVVHTCRLLLDMPGSATIIELSSTKGHIADALCAHPSRGRVVLSHPMAGTEYSGPAAAIAGLYAGKTVVLCDVESSDDDRLAVVSTMYETIGMKLVYQGSRAHDMHVAYVSHISHISSFALSLTVLKKEKDEKQIMNLAAGGFASTVRLAKSSPAMWTPILRQNSKHIIEVLDEYMDTLETFKQAIQDGNTTKIHALISGANAIATMLPSSHHENSINQVS